MCIVRGEEKLRVPNKLVAFLLFFAALYRYRFECGAMNQRCTAVTFGYRIIIPPNFSVAEKPKNDYNNKNQSTGNSPIKVELQNNMDR